MRVKYLALMATLLAGLSYLSFLLFVNWGENVVFPEDFRELSLRVLFLCLISFLTYQLVRANRTQALNYQTVAEQLAEAICRIIARPLDRSRPLWELYVIEGVENGTRIAQLTKIHHAAIDGEAGEEILVNLLDLEPDPPPPDPEPPRVVEPLPDGLELLARGLGNTMLTPMRLRY